MMNREGRNENVVQLVKTLQSTWPHREHESGVLRTMMCWLGLHLWLQPDYSGIAPGRAVRFCLWCSCVEVDGERYS
jgi:hypothetical protein